MPIQVSGVQYSGSWSLSSQANAKALGTWPVPPTPYLYAWGNGNNGGLGQGNTTSYSSPKQVGTLTTWSKISIGTAAAVIKSDGTLWMWGTNYLGQLGLGNVTYYSSPKQVGALTNWAYVANGNNTTLAVKTDGTLWAWGSNPFGQLGTGNTTNRSSPVQVGLLTNWLYVRSSTAECSYAIKTDGTLWAWGFNSSGQLGTGNTTSRSSPVQVGALTNWSTLSTGAGASCLAIKTDGTLWAWGENSNGQLGQNNTTGKSSPVQIGALTNWSQVVSGSTTALAIKSDGSLWGWGRNNKGQLGFGNATDYSSPKQVGALTNWRFVANSNGVVSAAITTNGALWMWGYNTYGNLGLGTSGAYSAYSSPKQVGALTTWQTIDVSNYALAIVGI